MNDSEQTEGEYLTALGFFEPFPFRHFVPRTLVGIWSSCFAAACNTPYSARFSPRFIVHRTRSARIPRTRGQLLGWSLYRTQKAPRPGSCRREATEGLRANSKAAVQPLRLLALLASTTLVGIWSSCYAAACNTPYSARFSPRCIAHRARSARIPFQGRLMVAPTERVNHKFPHEKRSVCRSPFRMHHTGRFVFVCRYAKRLFAANGSALCIATLSAGATELLTAAAMNSSMNIKPRNISRFFKSFIAFTS